MKKLTLITVFLTLVVYGTEAVATEGLIMKTMPACRNQDTLMQLGKLSGEDKEAYQKLLFISQASGECVMLIEGKMVFLEGNQSGLTKVRQKGNTSEYLTFPGAVQ